MPQRHSVYNSGANDGLLMGLYLTAIFILQIFGMRSVILSLLAEIMLLSVPVIAYRMLRRDYRKTYGMLTFSALWLHGILIFLCGGIILALVMYVYLRYINITFVAEQFQMVAGLLREIGTPEAIEQADIYDKILEKHLVPTPIQVSVSFIWLIGFSGAMLSILLALLVKAFNRNAWQSKT